MTSLLQAEESFEEMLNRQKAELNALMEAHRKQQLAFMRITGIYIIRPFYAELNLFIYCHYRTKEISIEGR